MLRFVNKKVEQTNLNQGSLLLLEILLPFSCVTYFISNNDRNFQKHTISTPLVAIHRSKKKKSSLSFEGALSNQKADKKYVLCVRICRMIF